MKIVLIGDSTTLPRNGSVKIEDTYFYRLCEHLRIWEDKITPWQVTRGGKPINYFLNRLDNDFDYIGNDADIYILSLGLVDCAPRPIPCWLRSGIDRLHNTPKYYVTRLIHYARPVTQGLGISFRYTQPMLFTRQVNKLIKRLNENSRVIIIGIPDALPETCKHSPGLGQSIKRYNQLLNYCAERRPNSAMIKVPGGANLVTPDIHYTKEGHELIYKMLVEVISK